MKGMQAHFVEHNVNNNLFWEVWWSGGVQEEWVTVDSQVE